MPPCASSLARQGAACGTPEGRNRLPSPRTAARGTGMASWKARMSRRTWLNSCLPLVASLSGDALPLPAPLRLLCACSCWWLWRQKAARTSGGTAPSSTTWRRMGSEVHTLARMRTAVACAGEWGQCEGGETTKSSHQSCRVYLDKWFTGTRRLLAQCYFRNSAHQPLLHLQHRTK